MYRRILFLILLCSASIASGADLPDHGNAGCVIRVGHQMVFVRDTWSGRLSLPGGTAEKGESSIQTAVREVQEETGLDVEVKRLLMIAPNQFRIYECEPKSGEIFVLGKDTIPHPKAFFNEISEVLLRNPHDLPNEKWRFQSQKELIGNLFDKAVGLPQEKIRSAQMEPNAWVATELSWISYFQQKRVLVTDLFFSFFSFLGGETFFIIMLPLLWCLFNKRFGVEAAFLFFLSTLLHGIAKQAFSFYRPFHYDPNLQLSHAQGFGFPSGHTTLIVVMWSFIALKIPFQGNWIWVGIVGLMGGLARTYFGVHFYHDVLGGWFLGAVIILLYRQSLISFRLKEIPIRYWYLASLVISLLALMVRFHPETTAVVAVMTGMIIAIQIRPPGNLKALTPSGAEGRVKFMIAVLGLFGIEIATKGAFPTEAAFFPCLIHNIIKYITMGLWMGLIPDSIWKAKKKRRG